MIENINNRFSNMGVLKWCDAFNIDPLKRLMINNCLSGGFMKLKNYWIITIISYVQKIR